MKSISIISIPVTDQQAAKEFYLKLGFKLLVEAPFDKGQKLGANGITRTRSRIYHPGYLV